MSHIAVFRSDFEQEMQQATPNIKSVGRRVSDFYRGPNLFTTPRRFNVVATPTSRRVKQAPDFIAESEEQEHTQELEGLIHRTWTVYSVGPLFDFRSDHFEELAIEMEKNLVDELRGCTKKVTIRNVLGLRGNNDDAQAVEIIVTQMLDDVEKNVFTAFLISVDASEVDIESPVTILPVCLVNGKTTIAEKILLTLEQEYDTTIFPSNFDKDNLLWMSALWANVEPDKSNCETIPGLRRHRKIPTHVGFTYTIPPSLLDKGIKAFDLTLNTKHVRSIWTSIHDVNETELSIEERDAFHQSVERHVHKRLGIDVQKLVMSSFVLPALSASHTGKLRMTNLKTVKSVLGYLTVKCQDLLSTNPRMAIEENGAWD